ASGTEGSDTRSSVWLTYILRSTRPRTPRAFLAEMRTRPAVPGVCPGRVRGPARLVQTLSLFVRRAAPHIGRPGSRARAGCIRARAVNRLSIGTEGGVVQTFGALLAIVSR